MPFQTKRVSPAVDYTAPDGSEIRLLVETQRGGLCHCTLLPGQTSQAVAHKTVEEMWYFIQGHGEFWRKLEDEQEEVVSIKAGVALTIPVGVHFQFRNTGQEPLAMIITTMPPWPSADEARPVEGHWPPAPAP